MSISLLNSAEFLSSKLSATSMNEPKSNLTIMVAGTTPEDERDLWVEGVG